MQIRPPPLPTFHWQMFVLSFALFWAVGGMPEPAKAQPRPQIAKCVPGQARTADEYCLVDGDTIWIDGEKLRMEGYDTPEPQTHICGGDAEIALAHRASDRVIELLNSHDWTVEYGEPDNTVDDRSDRVNSLGAIDRGLIEKSASAEKQA